VCAPLRVDDDSGEGAIDPSYPSSESDNARILVCCQSVCESACWQNRVMYWLQRCVRQMMAARCECGGCVKQALWGTRVILLVDDSTVGGHTHQTTAYDNRFHAFNSAINWGCRSSCVII
jgi:hypothetical protein